MRRIMVGAAAAGVLAAAAIAVAAPKNGGFESDSFKGWKTKTSNASDGRWYVYERGETEGDVRGGPLRGDLEPLPNPPQGRFAAIVLQGSPGARFLHRDLELKRNRKIRLSMKVFYDNNAPRFYTPKHFRFGPGLPIRGGVELEENQQYRIDILKASAPLKSLKAKHVLENIFITRPNAKRVREPFNVKANLTKYAGKKVTLRLAEVDNQEVLHAGVDAVKLTQKKR